MFAYTCDITRIDYEHGIHLFHTHFIHIDGWYFMQIILCMKEFIYFS